MANLQEISSRVVEIVGPAGAGKTTLLEALQERYPEVVPGISLSKTDLLPYYIRTSGFLLPLFLRYPLRAGKLTRADVRSMVYLKAWEHRLGRNGLRSQHVIMLDHGPVFRLVVLGTFGPEIAKSESYQAWWNKMLGRWSALLDTVIWLDAPDAVLFERINKRACSHLVKGRPEREVYTFLARYRAAYLDILQNLERNPRFRVFRFDTSRDTADCLAEKTWKSLAALPNLC